MPSFAISKLSHSTLSCYSIMANDYDAEATELLETYGQSHHCIWIGLCGSLEAVVLNLNVNGNRFFDEIYRHR